MAGLWLGLTVLGGADEVVQFRVEPPTAEVRVLPNGGWQPAREASLALQQTGELEFRGSGYRNLRVPYKRQDLLGHPWPPEGQPPLRLPATFPWWVAAPLPLLAGAVFVLARRRPAPPEPAEPVFGNYRLGEQLGRGGMATVYHGFPIPHPGGGLQASR